MSARKFGLTMLAAGMLAGAFAGPALAADKKKDPNKEQFIPVLVYRTGPFAAGGTCMPGGLLDYYALLNQRDGGINGIKLVWEECDTGYKTDRGVECYERLKAKGAKGAPFFLPMSTGVAYAVMDRAHKDKIPNVQIGYGRTDSSDGRVFKYSFPMLTNYWSQSSAKLEYIAQRMGGKDKLKGAKIVNLHLKHPYGEETRPIWDRMAAKYGFEVTHIPVPWPGIDQKSLWLQIRRIKPNFVINRNWGVSCTVPLREAARIGYPRDQIIGVWWCGAEEDVIPAGKAGKGYITAEFVKIGTDVPVIQEIFEKVYGTMKGNLSAARVGSVFHNRGVVWGIVTTEAIRLAHKKYGVGPVSGEQMQWAFENLQIDAARIKELGAEGLVPEVSMSCYDHEGGGRVRFKQWDGKNWQMITDWIDSDIGLVREMVEESAAKYAKDKKIQKRDCPPVGRFAS